MLKKFLLKSSFGKCARAVVGQKAPHFAGAAYFNGQTEVALSDFKDKYVVLFFYPLDFTFVCPTEILEFSKMAWTNLDRSQGGLGKLNYPLLADPTHKISK